MGFAASHSHAASLQLSSTSLHETSSTASPWSKSTVFTGAPLSFAPTTLSSKKWSSTRKKAALVVHSRKISGLEEAFRIMRLRQQEELQSKRKFRRKPPPLRQRGRVSPPLPVPDHIPKPPYVGSKELPELSSEYQFHDAQGIERMRATCELAARVLDFAGTLVRPSVTTDEIDKAVHKMIIEAGAYPSPLGYGGFPKSVCTSINECICHGIPDSRQLQGYHGDTSRTFLCGDCSLPRKNLVKVTEQCLQKGIAVCKDGASFKKIGKRICEHAEKYGYGVVERFVGHGVGTIFHSEPIILHHRNERPGVMVEGQTFTIEPILTMGSTECVTWPDNWTTLTIDRSPAAQFEHTILITRTGAEILTKC
uniref:Methionine aminopeptidase n=1 Tax=Rhizophora mucronata TaxID=61149 RepID=A0A2P2JM62_RHIMU